jgi:hypothetical protein
MSRTQEKALATCDGVIEIAKNEMLVRGNYITGIVDDKLKQQGAICGGRQACLVGSLYLAHGVPEMFGPFFSFSASKRENHMRYRPALRLAYYAINEAAHRRMKVTNPDKLARLTRRYGVPDEGWGEFFFETFLRSRPNAVVLAEVVQVIRSAKRLIRSGAVTPRGVR